MKFFIGIVPPEEIYTAVSGIQQGFGDNRLEPHITLRPPVIVTEEATWMEAIHYVCSGFPPVTIELPATGCFGNRVLFIDVSSDRLNHLHNSLLKALQPLEQSGPKEQKNQGYHPHLTLGRSWCGFTRQDFKEMKALADEFLSQRKVSFTAKAIRIYYKPGGTGRYAAKKDIELVGIN